MQLHHKLCFDDTNSSSIDLEMTAFYLTLMVKSINFVVLGKQDIAAEFGKKGTVTDLSLYDRKESNIIKTWVTPSGFPAKIHPLFQAIILPKFKEYLERKS